MLLSRKILQLINEGEIDSSFRRDDKLRKDEKVKDIIFSKINNLKLVMPKNEASVFLVDQYSSFRQSDCDATKMI
jgi:hypothetical protein